MEIRRFGAIPLVLAAVLAAACGPVPTEYAYEEVTQSQSSATSGGAVSTVEGTVPVVDTLRTVTTIEVFYEALAGYGDWVEMPPYGKVFIPDDTQYQPYTDGAWAYTDDGLTWVGSADWSWATEHYGRWMQVEGVWVWIPDTEWGPAWVEWRDAGTYVGWAPLGPDGWHSGAPVEQWVFVPVPYLFVEEVYTYYVPVDAAYGLYAGSTIVDWSTTGMGTTWCPGPAPRSLRERGAVVTVTRPPPARIGRTVPPRVEVRGPSTPRVEVRGPAAPRVEVRGDSLAESARRHWVESDARVEAAARAVASERRRRIEELAARRTVDPDPMPASWGSGSQADVRRAIARAQRAEESRRIARTGPGRDLSVSFRSPAPRIGSAVPSPAPAPMPPVPAGLEPAAPAAFARTAPSAPPPGFAVAPPSERPASFAPPMRAAPVGPMYTAPMRTAPVAAPMPMGPRMQGPAAGPPMHVAPMAPGPRVSAPSPQPGFARPAPSAAPVHSAPSPSFAPPAAAASAPAFAPRVGIRRR